MIRFLYFKWSKCQMHVKDWHCFDDLSCVEKIDFIFVVTCIYRGLGYCNWVYFYTTDCELS